MTDTCTVEVGLLKKHACGATAVTKCANCEQPLCTKHAESQMSGGKKTFLCHECARAWKKMGEVSDTPAATPGAAAAPAAAKKPVEAPKPPPAAAKPAPAKPAPANPAPAEKKPEPPVENSGALEFTPGKPSAPQPKAEPAPAPKPPPAPAGGKLELSIEPSAPPEDKK